MAQFNNEVSMPDKVDSKLREIPNLNADITASLKRSGPLTVDNFIYAANEYGLRFPEFDPATIVLKEKTYRAEGNTMYGQFSKVTGAKAGILRKHSHDGNSLSEFVCFRNTKIGLQRHFNFNGSVGYLIVDENAFWLESVFFDSAGKPLNKLGSEDSLNT